MDMQDSTSLATLERIRAESVAAGGEARVIAQHRKGKLTARERINLLLDEGSFEEFDVFKAGRGSSLNAAMNAPGAGVVPDKDYLGDGVITGHGAIHGREVFVFSQDFTVLGGSLGEAHAQKICKIMDMALKVGAPLIGLNDSGGARIQEGVDALAAYGEIFYRNVLASGVIPQISCIMGPCAGGAVYSPAMTDFVFMVEDSSYMFVTGPTVVKTVTHQDISAEALGGAEVHAEVSGVAHFMAPNDILCLREVRRLVSFLPSSNRQPAPIYNMSDAANRTDPALDYLVPRDSSQAYDMRVLIHSILDAAEFMEVHANFARNILCGFGRLGGKPVGLVANQPAVLAGVLDNDASFKAGRFVRFCDAFNIPIISLVDVPGFMPGPRQEHGGIIRHGSKLLFAFAQATVPRISVIVRKAYGGAYIVMNSKHVACDVNFAWPSAEIAVMGPKGAAEVIYRREISQAADPEAMLERKLAEYRAAVATPFLAAKRGYIDDVIFPRDTRVHLIRALQMLDTKHVDDPVRKHANIPL